jgi:predicted nucleotidyltransferase
METWKTGLLMASLSGSRLYGTYREDSDTDIRGVCFPPPKALLGLSGFEQYCPKPVSALEYSQEVFEVKSDDVTIYGLRKFFDLCLKANPNILELLFVPGESLLKGSDNWWNIVDCRQLFLSTKVVHSFAGYAYSQLSRIQRHRAWIVDPPAEPDPYEYGLVSSDEGAQVWENPQRQQQYKNLKRRWKEYQAWIRNRNPARAKLEAQHGYDTKYAAHLYRLVGEAEELLTTGYLTLPLKPNVRDTYMNVLNGYVSYRVVVEYGEQAKPHLQALEANSVLPKRPDHKKAEELLVGLHARWLERCGF